jgi:hypothetical protein
MVGYLMNNEFERMWKKQVLTKFDVLTWHLPGGTDENHGNSG